MKVKRDGIYSEATLKFTAASERAPFAGFFHFYQGLTSVFIGLTEAELRELLDDGEKALSEFQSMKNKP